ncbi:hypothetical protein ACYOEI_02530 [Singulisphaera rosea]
MDTKRPSTWIIAGLAFRLTSLDHSDLDDLYRRRLLPMVGPLRARFEKPTFDGDQDEAQAVEALHRCLESFRGILAASLRKAQPGLSEPEAAYVVAVYCGDEDDSTDEVTLYRQVQRLGRSTLEDLASKHRGRLTDLVSLAAAFEAIVTMPGDGEN